MTPEIHALILAAGKGTRMKSELPKVVHPILGRPMVSYVIDAVKAIGCEKTILVTGYKSELVKSSLNQTGLSYVEQKEQLGTGHAVQCYAKEAKHHPQHLLVVCGDTPLISTDTLKIMVEMHLREQPAITMMTLMMNEPGNYGRVLRKNGAVMAIREAKDCKAEELLVKEVNLAVYLFNAEFLFNNIFSLTSENKQKEYYLTDLVEIAVQKGLKVAACIEKDEASTLGINSRQHLAEVSAILQNQILTRLMDSGVTITSPENIFIGPDVIIEPDTTIHPGTMISGECRIGRDCVIGPNCHITDSSIGDNSRVEFCVISDASLPENSKIKPFTVINGGNK
ncbi:MAG: bifunctional N-acetylglucosamine-1-phosphate uridyltransferase/glucosamine-1-phosphate acetyltransferase [Erysipelotrichia bacterium]|nr:bifunctional N-acetylglucosamine-1-phosphate uridyltransferase/glucosamine-1-phosphate acetyltransferase [Erysipelotrichia bacterium]